MGVPDPAILPLSPQAWTGCEGTRAFAAEFSEFGLETAVEIDFKSSIKEAAVKVKRIFRAARGKAKRRWKAAAWSPFGRISRSRLWSKGRQSIQRQSVQSLLHRRRPFTQSFASTHG